MIRITLELPDGTKSKFIHADGITYEEEVLDFLPNNDLKSQIENVRNLKIRDDDIYLATYPRSGTHWAWEILVMLKRGTAEYETKTKEAAFLDFKSPDVVEAIPSPRVLNCHHPCKLTPKGIFNKQIKIVHVMRNPKDVFVSFYHLVKHFKTDEDTTDFNTFLSTMIGEHGLCYFYSWIQYVKEWERFTKQHPDQILSLFYEDLIEDPVREIKKINTFLATERNVDLIMRIADACNFQNLKHADAAMKVQDKLSKIDGKPSPMYRKGQVGDWKNHFTVAQNEKVDKWLEENLVDTELKFRYTL